jgi:hypothetical protein
VLVLVGMEVGVDGSFVGEAGAGVGGSGITRVTIACHASGVGVILMKSGVMLLHACNTIISRVSVAILRLTLAVYHNHASGQA